MALKQGRENMIGPLIKKISEETEWRVNEELRAFHLTRTQAGVVLYLEQQADHEASQKEVEIFLDVAHSTTVTILRSMQAKGIIDILPASDDRRMRIVRLTWGDGKIYRTLENNVDEMEERLLRGFSREEREMFLALCRRAEKNMR
jgi:DNA-binding MarR family transcriptional regulator